MCIIYIASRKSRKKYNSQNSQQICCWEDSRKNEFKKSHAILASVADVLT